MNERMPPRRDASGSYNNKEKKTSWEQPCRLATHSQWPLFHASPRTTCVFWKLSFITFCLLLWTNFDLVCDLPEVATTTTVCNDASRCSLAGLVTNCCRVSLSLRSVMTVAKKGVGRLGPREEGATALVVTYSSRRWCHSCRTEVRRDYGGRRKAVTQGLLCTFLSYGVLISEELSFCVCGCVCECHCLCWHAAGRR